MTQGEQASERGGSGGGDATRDKQQHDTGSASNRETHRMISNQLSHVCYCTKLHVHVFMYFFTSKFIPLPTECFAPLDRPQLECTINKRINEAVGHAKKENARLQIVAEL